MPICSTLKQFCSVLPRYVAYISVTSSSLLLFHALLDILYVGNAEQHVSTEKIIIRFIQIVVPKLFIALLRCKQQLCATERERQHYTSPCCNLLFQRLVHYTLSSTEVNVGCDRSCYASRMYAGLGAIPVNVTIYFRLKRVVNVNEINSSVKCIENGGGDKAKNT